MVDRNRDHDAALADEPDDLPKIRSEQMPRPFSLALIAIATIAGCTSEVQQERAALLGQPIDCATASEDITALAGVIPDRRERLSSGVRLVLPTSLVVGAASGQLGDRTDIASGRTKPGYPI